MTKHAQRKRTRSAPPARKATKSTTKKTAAKTTRNKPVAKSKAPAPPKAPRTRDSRLPAPGSEIVRTYKGKEIRVTVLEEGFTHDGAQYRSLTAVARAVTGYKAISGPAFFRLTEPKKAEETATD